MFPLQEQNQRRPGRNYAKQLKMHLFKDSAAGPSMRLGPSAHLTLQLQSPGFSFLPFCGVIVKFFSLVWSVRVEPSEGCVR